MAEINELNILAANNTARFYEGMNAGLLNDNMREFEAMMARYVKDTDGSINSSGTGSAYIISPYRTITAHAAGLSFVWKANVVNTGAATLQVGGLSAKPLKRHGGGALIAGDIPANLIVHCVYNASGDYYECIGIGDGAPAVASYTVAALPTGSVGRLAYASNGRKNGESIGTGTGVLVFHDGTAWRAVDTGATVAA
jgi:hypothetical protein